MKRRDTIWLVLFGVAMAVAAGLYSLTPLSTRAAEARYARATEQHVRQAVAEMNAEQQRLRAVLSRPNALAFSQLSLPTRYPYFIYRNRQLIAWSDYHFVPDYAAAAGGGATGPLHGGSGSLVRQRLALLRDADTLAVVSLLGVYRQQKVENNYLQSGNNQELLPDRGVRVRNTPSRVKAHNVTAADGTWLFALDFADSAVGQASPARLLSLVMGTLGLIFLGVYVQAWLTRLHRRHRYEWGFVVLAAFLFSIRAAMLYFSLPFSVIEWDLFNPKFYASSDTEPSLGDLLLNVLMVSVLALYLIRHYAQARLYRRLMRWRPAFKNAGSVVIVVLSYWLLYLHFYVLRTIYLHSKFTLDITQSLDFPPFKLLCLFIFLLNSGVYFMAVHILVSVFLRLNTRRRAALGWFGAGSLAYVGLFYPLNLYYPIILLLNACYFLLLYYFRLPRYLLRFRYQTTIYMFVAALVCATIGAYAVFSLEQMKRRESKQEFGADLLAENDALGEYLLDEAAQAIARDPLIASQIRDATRGSQAVAQRITQTHLNRYFNQYEVTISVFDAREANVDSVRPPADYSPDSPPEADPAAHPPGPPRRSYDSLLARYQRAEYKTAYANLYFVNEPGGDVIKQYVSLITVPLDSLRRGHVVLELQQKQVTPTDVYPELLVEKRFLPTAESRLFSYAVYSGGRLVFSRGTYNYDTQLPTLVRYAPALFNAGINWAGYQHVGVKGDSRRVVVVSSPTYPVSNVLSNFSFFFLLLVLVVVNFIITYALRTRAARFNTNFATKIQIFLNLAFFLPLLVVSIATLSIVSVAYRDNLAEAFRQKANGVSENLLPALMGYADGTLERAALTQRIAQIATFAEADVNLFDAQGALTFSSQPLIYESGILARVANPEAYLRIVEGKEKEVMLPESVGELNYNSAYVGVSSPRGKLLGIVSMPFFESRAELQQQIIGIVSTILNIFTSIFIFFLVLSYFASRILTVPLRLITRKIQKTSLNDYNDPLEWQSDDEIGLLVGEYNRMLVKLEANKVALSQSEKESAWREMAKQVAHEIKNPLTPMKLTLQHLQRTLPAQDAPGERASQRAFTTLLEQIDNLSDIATSFSDFAKMPSPKNEVFELAALLRSTAGLHATDAPLRVTLDLPADELRVVGDRQLMGGVFNNLIINGIQSVPASRPVRIVVAADPPTNGRVTIEVRDNGTGISEKLRASIFVPNFSTKYAGSGIGLALARRGVEHAGGRIWFETQEGHGTSFFVELLLAKE